MIFHDFEPWLGQVYPRRNLSIVVLVVRRTKKRRGLKKRQKRQYKNYSVPNKGPSRADSGSYYVLGKYRSPQIHPFGGPLLYVMFFMWPFLPASF